MRPLVLMFAAALAVIAVCHALLPETVATHFGLAGAADGWAPKGTFTALMAGLDILMFAIFWLTPRLVMWLPPSLVNLPHRDYWLRDARHRDRARATLEREMGGFGAGLLGFLSLMMLLTTKANLDGSQHLDMPLFVTAMAAFLVGTAVWCVHLVRAFRIPPDQPADSPVVPR